MTKSRPTLTSFRSVLRRRDVNRQALEEVAVEFGGVHVRERQQGLAHVFQVLPHGVARGDRVFAFQGVQDNAVVFQPALPVGGVGDVAVQLFPHRAGAALQPEAVDAFCQHAVLCRLGDAQVELFVAAVVGDAIARFLFLDLQDALQRVDVGFGDGQRGDFGDAAFQHLPRLHEFKRADVAVVGFRCAIIGQAGDVHA